MFRPLGHAEYASDHEKSLLRFCQNTSLVMIERSNSTWFDFHVYAGVVSVHGDFHSCP